LTYGSRGRCFHRRQVFAREVAGARHSLLGHLVHPIAMLGDHALIRSALFGVAGQRVLKGGDLPLEIGDLLVLVHHTVPRLLPWMSPSPGLPLPCWRAEPGL
jgi:hypothetical protein